MNTHLTPAELRAAVRLMALYPEAAADLAAKEEASEAALSVPTVAPHEERFRSLLDPAVRDQYAAYLDRVEVSHGHDPAMRAYIDRSRAALAADAPAPTSTSHLEA